MIAPGIWIQQVVCLERIKLYIDDSQYVMMNFRTECVFSPFVIVVKWKTTKVVGKTKHQTQGGEGNE